MLNTKHSTIMKNHYINEHLCCFGTTVIILFILTSSHSASTTDSMVQSRQFEENRIEEQNLQTFKTISLPNSVKAEPNLNLVKRINSFAVHQTNENGGHRHRYDTEFKTVHNNIHSVHNNRDSVHNQQFSDVSGNKLIANESSSNLDSNESSSNLDSNHTNQRTKVPGSPRAMKTRKERSLHDMGLHDMGLHDMVDLNNNHTTSKPLPTSVKVGVISPTPVLTSSTREHNLHGEQYESPQEVQDDMNEDMLNLLNARGFSYTALPDDMMSKYPDIVRQVEADEMEGEANGTIGQTQGAKGQGQTTEGEGQTGDGEGPESPDSEGSETDGKDMEGPEEEENEVGENDSDKGDNEKAESPESSQNQTDSELISGKHSDHGEHSEDKLQPSMTELSHGSTDRHDYMDYDYVPYYNEPGQTALAGGPSHSIATHQIHRLPNIADRDSGLSSGHNRSGGFEGTRRFHPQQGHAGGFLPIYQQHNLTGRTQGHQGPSGSGQRLQFNGTNSGQHPPPGFLPIHQLHNVGHPHTAQSEPGGQANVVHSSAVPINTAHGGLPASTIFGIVAGCVIGSWMILGPLICLLCKYRDACQEKRKRFSPRLYHGDSNNGITEAMIMSELGKDPIKMHHTNYRQRESTYSERSDTYHDAYETPPLLP